MSERLIAYSLAVSPSVIDGEKIGFFAGGGDTKYHFQGVDASDQKTRKSFIWRIFDRDLISNWKKMKNVGLPVPEELLLNPMRGFVLLTDVKADGSEVYGKGLSYCLNHADVVQRDRPRPEIDKIFLELTTQQKLPILEEAAQQIVSLANEHNFELPYDDGMELIIHPDGSWNMIILDIRDAKTDQPLTTPDAQSRQVRNAFYLGQFIHNLRNIRNHLTSSL